MGDNIRTFLFLLCVVVLGAFAALIAWTLIVKTQVSQTLQTASQSNPLLAALGGL